MRKDATKVWHNPEIATVVRRERASNAPRPTETPEDKRAAKQNLAALEALFAPKRDAGEEERSAAPTPKPSGRIVLTPPPNADPRTAERQKLLGKLLNAAGRPAVSKAANELLRAGFSFPEEQEVYLQLLEHVSEEQVLNAIDVLGRILASELPKRRAVLESRLRRIEQFADEPTTRKAAERLWRQVTGRGDNTPSTPPTAQ